MAHGTAPFIPHFSSGIPTIMGVVGTLGTADTGGTASLLPVGVRAASGAMYVHISGTDVNTGGGTNVNIVTGTQQALGTIGTLGIGSIHVTNTPTVAVGTIGTLGIGSIDVRNFAADIPGGTTDLITRVSNVGTVELGSVVVNSITAGDNNIGNVDIVTLPDLPGGTIDLITGVTTVSNLTNGSVRMTVGTVTVLPDLPGGTLDLGTVVGADAVAGTSTTRPVQMGGTTSTGTVYGMLVDTAGNPQVDIVNTPSVSLPDPVGSVVVTVGTVSKLPSDGTITQVTTVSNLTNGSVRMTVGTVTTGSLGNVAMLHAGTVNASLVSSNGTITRIGNVGTIESMPAVGGGTQFAEDAAHTSSDGGNVMLAVRTDGGTALAADGDYHVLETDANGALRITGTVTTGAGTQAVRLIDGTLTNVSTGTLNALAAGTITAGTVAVTIGSVVGPNASAGTSTTAPVQVGGTTSTGTVYGMLVDTAGNPQVDIVNTPTVVLPNPVGSVTMTVGTVTTGSLSNVAMLNAGTINTLTSVTNLVSGTLLNSGTTTGVGVVSNLTSGSVTMTVGTLTTGTLQNLVSGTINALAAGTITGGTLGNLNDGTVHVDSLPPRTLTSYGTLGTTGAAVFGTILAAVGAGTNYYLHGLSMVVTSGTLSAALMNGTSTDSNGAGVFGRGLFVPGGGMVRDYTTPVASGTNGTLVFWMSGAGTAYFTAQYFVV